MKKIPTPAPGIYYDVPGEEYRRWDALNCSTLVHALEHSMLALRWSMENPKKQTEDMYLGTAIHAAILEPGRFLENMIEPPINPKGGKPYGFNTNTFQEFLDAHPGKFVIGEEDAETINRVIKAVQANPYARGAIFAERRACEVSIVFDAGTEETGPIPFKCRLDCVTDAAIVDIKSMRKMPLYAVPGNAWSGHWPHRAVMYRRGAASVGLGNRGWVWLAAEKEPPYDVMVCETEDASMLAAEVEVDAALAAFAECSRTGVWPGRASGSTYKLAAPDYAIKRAMIEAENAAAFA